MNIETLYSGFFKLLKIKRDDGVEREVVDATDSVSVLIYDTNSQQFILTRQHRPGMAIRGYGYSPYTVEAVAGRFDEDIDIVDLIIKEAKEEVGVELKSEDIRLLNNGTPMAVSSGMTNEVCYLAIAEIPLSEKHPAGRVTDYNNEHPRRLYGASDEKIERVFVGLHTFRNMTFDDVRTFALAQEFKGVK